MSRLVFFLGGGDLEMLAIRELLDTHGVCVVDRELGWDEARVSRYAEEIARAVGAGDTAVLVELTIDGPLPTGCIVVDHHGERAGEGKPGSLRQVFELLRLPESAWTRQMDLIAANDSGYLPAMQALGATVAEMTEIRARDRAAQGLTADEERSAAAATAARRFLANGRLAVVELDHRRSGVVADLLAPELGGPGADNLLVLMPDETAFYGEGTLVAALDGAWPGGWRGGALPRRGYWGVARRLPEVADFLAQRLAPVPPNADRHGVS